MKKFIGIQQWNVFFISLAIVFVILIFVLILVGLNPLLSIIIPIVIVVVVFAWALIKSYRFFVNNPKALDIKGQRYVAVPHKHVAIVLINGEYQGYLEPGYYFVFPFFGLVTFNETIFLGTVEEDIFEENNKVEFSEGVTAAVKGVYNFQVVDVEKYAFQDGADEIVKGIVSSLVRTALGDLNIKQAREGGYSASGEGSVEYFLTHVRNEDMVLFDSILEVYGMDILAINIADIELSEEEIALNRQRHEANIAKEIASFKAEEREILAAAEAKVLALRGEGLSQQVKLLAENNCDPNTILAYLAETEKWKTLKETDKTFIIDNGKSVAGMLAALKGVEGGV